MQKLVCMQLWIQLGSERGAGECAQADILHSSGQLEDLVDRQRGLLSCFLSSREVAVAVVVEVKGMGLPILKQSQQQFIESIFV